MRKLLIIAGILLITISSFYFLRLVYYLLNSYEFTNYGYGILTGKILILVTGVVFLYLGIRMKKKQKNLNKDS